MNRHKHKPRHEIKTSLRDSGMRKCKRLIQLRKWQIEEEKGGDGEDTIKKIQIYKSKSTKDQARKEQLSSLYSTCLFGITQSTRMPNSLKKEVKSSLY